MTFDPLVILATLRRHRVTFVVVGGMAAAMHGSDMVTFDLDVTPDRHPDNLASLAAALRELEAAIRLEGADVSVAFEPSAAFLANVTTLNLTTLHGDLDLVMVPAGLSGYDNISHGAQEIDIDGVVIRIANLADVIASKEAANRAKDRLTLPGLRILQRKIAEGE